MWVHVAIVALVSAVFLGRLVHVLVKRPRKELKAQRPTA
jgi:hypothetical protein